MKNLLQITFIIFMLPPSEINGGYSAPLMRLFYFKVETTAQDSHYREVWGVSIDTLISLGLFYLSKINGGSMQPKASTRALLTQQKQFKKQLTTYAFLAGTKLNHLRRQYDEDFLSINFGRIQTLAKDLSAIQQESALLINKLYLINDQLQGRGIYEQN